MIVNTGYSFSIQQVTQSCNCLGKQPGFPRCPCQMRGLIERDGRWIQPEQDLGPISTLTANKSSNL
jgi:hypothetical protein